MYRLTLVTTCNLNAKKAQCLPVLTYLVGTAAGKLVGDSLLAAAFVSYAGPFNMEFRKRLVTEKWLPDLTERQIPLTPGFMPLDMLADESSKVSYKCQRLLTTSSFERAPLCTVFMYVFARYSSLVGKHSWRSQHCLKLEDMAFAPSFTYGHVCSAAGQVG